MLHFPACTAAEGGWTQLISAVHESREQRVRELVAAGAKLDLVFGTGWSALHFASSYGHVRITKLLLNGKYEGKGADINLQTVQGYTVLIRASAGGHEAVVRLLLERGADVTLRSASGRTALFDAKTDAIKALLRAQGATA